MVIAAHEVRPIPTMGIADFGKMSLALFASCVVVSIAPLWLPVKTPDADLSSILVNSSGAGKSAQVLLREQYSLALESLNLPKDTPETSMLALVETRLKDAKLSGLEPANEASYVLGVHRGALPLEELKKRLMLLDQVILLLKARDPLSQYGCADMADKTIFVLLNSDNHHVK